MLRLGTLLLCVASSLAASAATYTVTASGDTGPGTLKAAINAANANPGRDQIVFAIDRIELTEDDRAVTDPVDIDGRNATIVGPVGIHELVGPGFWILQGAAGSTVRNLIHEERGVPLIWLATSNTILENISSGWLDVRGTNNILHDVEVRALVLGGSGHRITNSTIEEVRVFAKPNDITFENNELHCLDSGDGSGWVLRGNTFRDCSGDAVTVGGTGVEIQSNHFFNVIGKPISLEDGGNHNQPAPTLLSAALVNGTVIVAGTVTGAPSTQFRVELYSQAQTPLESFTVTTDATGNGAFRRAVTTPLSLGHTITATATNVPLHETSEMSEAIAVGESHVAEHVPTLSEWALITMAAMLALVGLRSSMS